MNLYRKSSALLLYICFINVCVFNVYLCIYGIINYGDGDFYWRICGHFYGNDYVKFIHDQFFERERNVMIIVYNRNASTRDPGSDETDIFRRQSPTRIRTVKMYVVQLPSLTIVPGDQRPGIYYSGIHTLLFITICPVDRHVCTCIIVPMSQYY